MQKNPPKKHLHYIIKENWIGSVPTCKMLLTSRTSQICPKPVNFPIFGLCIKLQKLIHHVKIKMMKILNALSPDQSTDVLTVIY